MSWSTTFTTTRSSTHRTTPRATASPLVNPMGRSSPPNSTKTQQLPSRVDTKTKQNSKVRGAESISKTQLQVVPNHGHRLLNLSMYELRTNPAEMNPKETKRRDITRPVCIPRQTYHPDELRKISFDDSPKSRLFYFCKEQGSTLWRIPKEEPCAKNFIDC